MNAKITLAMLLAPPKDRKKIKRLHDEHYRKVDKAERKRSEVST